MFSADDWPEQRATAVISRPPAAVGGTAGSVAVAGTVVGALMPAELFSARRLDSAPDGLGGARYDLAFVTAGTVVRVGDLLAVGGGTARVQRVDVWAPTASVAFVERVM